MTDEIRKRFDERAPDYDTSSLHRGLAQAVAAFADLDGVTDVLDVATGTALVLRALHDRAPSLHLTGVDLSPGMLTVARAELPGADLIEGDAHELPVADASIDLVTCVTALHLFPDTDAVVAEWARVLRPGGRVVTGTFVDLDPAAHPSAPASRHALFSTPERMEELLRPAGLVATRHEHWSHGAETALIAEFATA